MELKDLTLEKFLAISAQIKQFEGGATIVYVPPPEETDAEYRVVPESRFGTEFWAIFHSQYGDDATLMQRWPDGWQYLGDFAKLVVDAAKS